MKSDGLTVHSSRVESIVERAEGTRLEEGSRHGNARTTMIGERHSQTTRTRTAEARRVSTGTPERRTAVERTKKSFKIPLAAAAIWGRWSKGSQDEDFNSYILQPRPKQPPQDAHLHHIGHAAQAAGHEGSRPRSEALAGELNGFDDRGVLPLHSPSKQLQYPFLQTRNPQLFRE